ncbi:type I restriction enzyme M protein [Runella defluvii]|jgi:type I restriction enzyme M protein|uniref:site-specific DNA-methyltransferase (adenine-specific) n=1 Tax=Runella defluvii TaxID=370973 RepID=A0A7W6ETK2_9BACT|nr:type I restriction-modification system subunit M [Runella defluvii]MBB3841859.1 type I restriction enzyme M protein [Runella defluvii]
MSKIITQSEINNAVWKACDTFRGVIDPSQYKDYILTFLFVKYLSDLWKDRYNYHLNRYDGNTERTERAMRNERFQLPEHCQYDYLHTNRNEPNIGELINEALEELQDSNRTKLEGVFRNIDFNSESNLGQTKDRNRRLKNLIEDFKNVDLTPSHLESADIIGDVYEFLIERFASDAGKKAGEFYTPSPIATLLAALMNPQPGNRICDPTCGSGSLLIKVAQKIGSNNFSIYGQEVNGSTYALARMNMFLHGMDDATIRWGDTINNPLLLEGDNLMKYDIVVANPPFSLDKWGAEDAGHDRHNRFWRGVPPKSKGDFAFISHMIETAYEGKGKVGVVVPHGVLFRGAAEGKIRQQLIEDNVLEAVIGLPANLFFGTGIPTAIMVFNKGKQTSDVLFIDASKEYAEGKNQNSLSTENINHITETYRAFQTSKSTAGIIESKYAYRADIEEIRQNDYNLNIPRYVDTFEEEPEIDLKATQSEIDNLENRLTDIKQQMKAYLQELGI